MGVAMIPTNIVYMVLTRFFKFSASLLQAAVMLFTGVFMLSMLNKPDESELVPSSKPELIPDEIACL